MIDPVLFFLHEDNKPLLEPLCSYMVTVCEYEEFEKRACYRYGKITSQVALFCSLVKKNKYLNILKFQDEWPKRLGFDIHRNLVC